MIKKCADALVFATKALRKKSSAQSIDTKTHWVEGLRSKKRK